MGEEQLADYNLLRIGAVPAADGQDPPAAGCLQRVFVIEEGYPFIER
jgi:hypothetical protein